MVPPAPVLGEADAPEKDGVGLAVAHHCESTGVVNEASEMVWRVGCGQAWETQMHGRRRVKVAPWIAENRGVTSCAADDHLRRANAILTWAVRSDLKSSDMTIKMACVPCCTSGGTWYVWWAATDVRSGFAHCFHVRPVTRLWLIG